MLVRYRKDYQKIALGLLSLVKDLRKDNRFTEEMDWASRRLRLCLDFGTKNE